MILDTNQGVNMTILNEVSDDQKTTVYRTHPDIFQE